MLNVGLFGAGRWGRLVLRDLVALGCRVSVVDPDGDARRAACGAGAAFVTSEIDELAAVDGVVVATPATTHATVVGAVLDRHVPVFVEKPMTTSARDAASLVTKGSDRLFVMDKWRYHPAVRCLRDLAYDDRVGTVRGLRTVRVGPPNEHPDVDCVWTLVPHDLAIALELFGEVPEPIEAVAHRNGSAIVGLEASLRTRDDRWHHLEVSIARADKERRIELEGDAARACFTDQNDGIVTIAPAGSPSTEASSVEAGGELPLLAELRVFVEHLRGGPAPMSTAAEGQRVVEVIEGLRRLAGLP